MATTLITVETGLQVLSQILTLVQAAQASGQPIDGAAWNAAIGARDTALVKLDADIAAGPA